MSELEALQGTLAAEHAAVWSYGLLAGRVSGLSAPALARSLATAYDVHVARRDRLRLLVTQAGAEPVAAEPAYRVARPLDTRAQLAAEAARVEGACVPTYAALVAATAPGATRALAVSWTGDSAVAEADFGGVAQPLPGLTLRGRGR